MLNDSAAIAGQTQAAGTALQRCLSHAWITCITAMFALPFLSPWRIKPISSFYGECLAAVLLLCAALAALLHSAGERSKQAYPVPLAGFIFLPLIAVIGLQFALGKYTYASNALFPVLLLALAGIAAVLGAASTRQFGLDRLMCWISAAVIVGGLISFLIQVLQLYGAGGLLLPWLDFRSNGSRFGALGQPNHLATYLGWSLIACLYLQARGIFKSWLGGILLTVLLTGMALTASRMTWLQIGCIALAGAYFVWKMDAAARPRYWRLLLLLPLWYLAVTLALPYLGELARFDLNYSSLTRFAGSSVDGGRALIYAQAWEIFRNHPLFGVGVGQMIFHQFMLMDHYTEVLFDNSGHNILLGLLVTTGLAGTLTFLLFFLAALWRICKPAASLERAAMLLMLMVLGIHTLLEYPEWYAYFLLPAAFLFGCLDRRDVKIGRNLVSRTLPPAAVLYGLLLCAMLCVQYAQLQVLHGRYYAKNRLVESIAPAAVDSLERFHQGTLFSGPAEFLLAFNLALNEIALERKLEISRRAMQYLPEPNIVYRHLVLLALSGRQEEGVVYLARLKAAFPEAYLEVAAELRSLAQRQPRLFDRLGAEVERLQAQGVGPE